MIHSSKYLWVLHKGIPTGLGQHESESMTQFSVPLNKTNWWNEPMKWNCVSPCDPVMADQCQHIIIVPVYNSSASASLLLNPSREVLASLVGRNDFLLNMFIWEWGVNSFTATMHTTCTELESIHFYLPVVKITSLFRLLSTIRFIWFCI